MRVLLSLYLALSIGGIPGSISLVLAAVPDTTAPVVRHTPPALPLLGTTMAIQAVVEGGTRLAVVRCWYRARGAAKYDSAEMTRLSGNTFECEFKVSEAFAQGIEYFVEAVDESGASGTDGTKARPYYVTVRERPSVESLALRTTGETQKPERSIWKSPWLWLGAALAVAGGIAVANGGGKDNSDTGTIIAQ
jgi:hypothetical protein